MEKDNIEEYTMTFSEYVNNIYNYTVLNSIVFSTDIREFITEHLNMDRINEDALIDNMYNYLLDNKDDDMFDENIKENFYFLIDYLLKNMDKNKIKQKNPMINEMKRMINNLHTNNLEYLREQILLREHAFINYNWNKLIINKISDSTILEYKDIYYNSISNDLFFLHLLLINDEQFYKEYSKYLLHNDFYRSVNYFMSIYDILFTNIEYLKRIQFIIEQNSILINKGENVDKDFIALEKISKKVVKKYEKSYR